MFVLSGLLLACKVIALIPLSTKFLSLNRNSIQISSYSAHSTSTTSVPQNNEVKGNHIKTLNTYKATISSVLKIEDSDWRGWTDRPSPDECFNCGPFSCRIGRKEQIKQIWEELNYATNLQGKRSPCYYIHASPGMGKSFILRELMRKNNNDIDSINKELVDSVMFVALDLNNDKLGEICEYYKDINKWDRSILPLLCIFHQEFLKTEVDWSIVVASAVTLSRNDPDDNLDELIPAIKGLLKAKYALLGHSHIVPLVDEPGKTHRISADFPDSHLHALCSWSDYGFPNYFAACSVITLTDRKLIERERYMSRRPMIAPTTLPPFDRIESKAYLDALLKCTFINSRDEPVDREPMLEVLAQASGGHPRSLGYLVDACNYAYIDDEYIEDIITQTGQFLTCSIYYKIWEPVIKLALQGVPRPLEYNIPGTDETIETLINKGVLLGSLDDETYRYAGSKPLIPDMLLYWWSRVPISAEATRQRDITWDLEEEMAALRVLLGHRGGTHERWQTQYYAYKTLTRWLNESHNSDRKPLYEIYGLNKSIIDSGSGSDRSLVTTLPVDHCTQRRVSKVPYKKGTKLEMRPNTLYYPDSDNMTVWTWDSLFVYQAFPEGASDIGSEEVGVSYILPVFIQYNLIDNSNNKNISATKLTAEIEKCYKKCLKFLNTHCICAPSWYSTPGYQLPPTTDKFVLIYITNTPNTITNTYLTPLKLPTNVIVLYKEDLPGMYGPILTRLIDPEWPVPHREVRVRGAAETD